MNDQQFVQNFARVTALTWVDEEYKNRLLNDPRETLLEAGIITPPDAEVRITEVQPEQFGTGNVEGQIARWHEGEKTGVYEFALALKPDDFDPDNVALSDMQLDVVAGGLQDAEAIDVSCCSCTPCTCCT